MLELEPDYKRSQVCRGIERRWKQIYSCAVGGQSSENCKIMLYL